MLTDRTPMAKSFDTHTRLIGRLKRSAWVLLSVSLGCGAGLGMASDVDSKRMLIAHNDVRIAVGVGPLQWAPRLESSALRWARLLVQDNGCEMKHSGPGENLYWASPTMWDDGRRERQQINEEDVVASWASESKFYDRGKNSCRQGKVCGHYTQVIWRDTTEIGCAKSFCPNQGQIWVCHYRPSGNLVGKRP